LLYGEERSYMKKLAFKIPIIGNQCNQRYELRRVLGEGAGYTSTKDKSSEEFWVRVLATVQLKIRAH
jgi:hypothetical protein